MRNWYVFTIFFAYSCLLQNPEQLKELTTELESKNDLQRIFVIKSIDISGGEVIVNGENLDLIDELKLDYKKKLYSLKLIRKENKKLVLRNIQKDVTLKLHDDFFLKVLSQGKEFNIPAKVQIKNKSLENNHLKSMGALSGQTLKFDGVNWIPGQITGLRYRGAWNAFVNSPDLTDMDLLKESGDYFLVTMSGTTDLSGGLGTNTWSMGDWAVWNGENNRWEKVKNTSDVLSFNGRVGAIAPTSGDYSLALLGDVDLTGLANDKILKYDTGTSSWIIADDNNSPGPNTVVNEMIADNNITAIKLDSGVITDLTSLSNKLNRDGSITMTGDLDMDNTNKYSITNVGNIHATTLGGLSVSTMFTDITNFKNNKINLSGTMPMTGTLNLGTNSINNIDTLNAASLASTNLNGISVSTLLSNYNNVNSNMLPVDGSTALTGDLDMGANNIANVGTIDSTLITTSAFTSRGIVDNASSKFLYVDSGNQIGVGLADPLRDFHVYGSLSDNSITVKSDSGNDSSLDFQQTGQSNFWQIKSDASENFVIRREGLGNLLVINKDTGNVLINGGTTATNPGARLDVRGNIRVGNDNSTCGSSNLGEQRLGSNFVQFCSYTGTNYMWLPTGNTNISSFQSGWSNYNSSDHEPLNYSKGQDGVVTISGVVKHSAGGTNLVTGYVTQSIPVGYRPNGKIISMQNSYTGKCRLDVGTVEISSVEYGFLHVEDCGAGHLSINISYYAP